MKESDKKERRKRMKISVWNNIGDYSRSLDIEYNSELETDCVQAEKYIIALTSVCAEVKTEVTEDAEP